ncbi:MAG: lipid-A-disaccharide synthase [Candidatus Omnitrophica bacterium]|nr:lipid-A-disaccharide synthase [Candidatus Omnitrophota bacterium]
MAKKQILIVCGEASGDLNAANLAKEILKVNPEIKISAVGGSLLRQAGAEIFYDIKGLAVIGFFDVLKKLPVFFRLKRIVLEKISAEKPDAVVLVDFSGFNLRLAKEINNQIPVIYYISPQVWASRSGRIETIKKYIRSLIVLFKFEEEFYKQHGVAVRFAGHPLLDIVKPSLEKKGFLQAIGFSETKNTLALLPGSRKQEIENILPIMLKTCEIIAQNKPDLQIVIAKSNQVDWEAYRKHTAKFKLNLKIIEGKAYDCLNIADFALVASGTATLETAIMQKPFVIIYRMNLLNYLLYRPQVRIPYIGMVNIVAQKKIIPEFIQLGAQPARIACAVLKILQNPSQLEQMKNDLLEVKNSLGEKGASLRAAQILLTLLDNP